MGCLIAGPLANKYGRKLCIQIWYLIFCIGVIVQVAIEDSISIGIVIGQWVVDLSINGLSIPVSLYISETFLVHI